MRSGTNRTNRNRNRNRSSHRVRLLEILTLAVFVHTFEPSIASACTCVLGPETCPRVADAAAVFEATVASIEVHEAPQIAGQARSQERLVRLRDVRAIRGQPQEEVVTGLGGGDCGYAFTVGGRYVIVGQRRQSDQRLQTSICSQTQLLSEASGLLSYLQSLDVPSRGARIWGRLVKPNARNDSASGIPIADARIMLRGAKSLSVTTGKNGEYEFVALPPGTYTVSADLGPGLKPLAAWLPVTLDGAYACTVVDLWVR